MIAAMSAVERMLLFNCIMLCPYLSGQVGFMSRPGLTVNPQVVRTFYA